MAITIPTKDISVVGKKVVVTESEMTIPTKLMPELTEDSSVDTVVGLKNGAVVQVDMEGLKQALDAAETVQTSTFTSNGVSFTMAKQNGICTLSALSGSLSTDFGANVSFATIPADWRPAIGLEVTETSSGTKRINIGASGAIQTASTYVRFTVTYVLA